MLEERFSTNFICNFNNLTKVEDLQNAFEKQLWSGQWTSGVDSKLVREVLQNCENLNANDEEVIFCAISFLLEFVRENFTGPSKDDLKDFISNTFPNDFQAIERLSVNGEELNANVKYPELLLGAKLLLQAVEKKNPNSVVLQWWKLRLVCIHQSVMDEMVHDLYVEFKELAATLLKDSSRLNNVELEALLYVEISNGFLRFRRTQKSDEVLVAICSKLDVNLKVEGLLGVRTKYQQKPLPQLCLKVEQTETSISNNLPSALDTNGSTNIPKLLKHEDDVRLEKIKFVAEEDNDVLTIPSVLQALVLAKIKHIQLSQPKDRLADEELEPYTTTLLHQDHGPLPVRLSTLLFNIKQEANHKRTVERSLKQCEEVLTFINGEKYDTLERLSYGFAAQLIPRWEAMENLGDLMVSLGMVKTALDLYLEIQCWEKVIESYTHLELRHKAAEIIRQELEKKPTVQLYCLLGDATDDISCYETAWRFSKERSGRAQRHWGNYLFAKKEYANAIPHVQLSVEINPIQEVQWLRLGYAAMMIEDWKLSAQAYIRYTHLEPHGFEAWNNLAKALIKLGDKPRAHKMLSEALKNCFSNWKLWENFMLVSVDTCNFEDALNAYHRLNELKDRFIDLEVLSIVIPAIAQDRPDAEGRPTKRLVKKASTLLGHQCVQHASEPKLWELAAIIATSPLSKAQKLQKAYRACTQKDTAWASKEAASVHVLSITIDLCQSSLEAVERHEESENSSVTSQLSSARLSAQACVRAVENNGEKWADNDSLLVELKELFAKTTDELKKRM